MKASLKLKALAAAAALFASGAAFANTNLDTGTAGSIWVNVNDTTNGSSFVYDTGLNQTTISSSSTVFSVNTSLASDPNWEAFVAGEGSSDAISYDVVSVSGLGSGGNTFYTTANAKPSAPFNSALASPSSAAGTVAGAVNGLSSGTSNSAYITVNGASANNPTASASWSTNLDGGSWGNLSSTGTLSENGALGTSLHFYEVLGTTGSKATVGTFGFTWDLTSAGLLSYNPQTTSTVPVPAPFGLLIAGLALMGVIARRGKSAGGDFGGAAA